MVGFAIFAMSLVLPQLLQDARGTGYGLGQSMLVDRPVHGARRPGDDGHCRRCPRASRPRGAPKVTLMRLVVIAVGYVLGFVLMGQRLADRPGTS